MSYKLWEAVVRTQPLLWDCPDLNSGSAPSHLGPLTSHLTFLGLSFQGVTTVPQTHRKLSTLLWECHEVLPSLSTPVTQNKVIAKTLPCWEKKLKSPESSSKQVLRFVLSKTKEAPLASGLCKSEVEKSARARKSGLVEEFLSWDGGGFRCTLLC